MGVKAIQCFIFLLGFLFSSGTFARELGDQTHSLSSHPAFFLKISNFDHELPIENPAVDLSKKESIIHKGDVQNFPSPHRLLLPLSDPESFDTMPQLDVVTPMTTVPTINPTTTTTTTPTYSDPTPTYSNPTPTTTPVTSPYTTPTTNPVTSPYTTPTTTPTTNPVTSPYTTPTTTPTTGTPTSSSGQSWCVASQSASQTALQVALDYACGYGGADCSAIQQGGSCFNPDTIRDHASYAFNSYYQKNPVTTSCDFGGTAVITNTDPSSSTCQFPSASTSSSTLNTTNPTGSTVFGGSPPDYSGSISPPDYSGSISKSISMPPSFTLMVLLLSVVYLKIYENMT